MTNTLRIARLTMVCGLGLLLPLVAHGQSDPAAPSPEDTVYTSLRTALWASSDAVDLKTSLPPETALIVEAVEGERLRVRSEHGRGWVSRSALNPERTGVRHSTAGSGNALSIRPSWRASLRARPGYGLAIPRLALYRGRDGGAIVSVLLSNSSREQTVKSVHLGLALYDLASDSTAQNVVRRTVRVVGPLEPRSLASYDVGIPKDGARTCAGIRWVQIKHLNGTTITSTPQRPSRAHNQRGQVQGRGFPYSGDGCRGERSLSRQSDSP